MSVLELRGICKSFSNNHVLNDVSFSLNAGEIHSIIGENGAGKSTLIKIIGGIYSKDSGEMLVDGVPVNIHNPVEAYKAGIGIVHQELSLSDNMTVAQNVFVNREPTTVFGLVDKKKMEAMAEEEFKKIGIAINPSALVRDFSTGIQQVIEIVKVLSQNVRILILDEPTSSLSDKETNNLFELLFRLRERGTCIIFISHKLNEIKRLSDRVSVLRDGNFIGTLEREQIDEDLIISMMVGREINNLYPPKAEHRDGAVVLSAKHCTRIGKFQDISLDIRAGEILGFFGLVGAGRTEFAWSLFGADRMDSGEVEFDGRKVRFGSPTEAINAGFAYLSEDRKRMGLFVNMTVKDNIMVTNLSKVKTKGGMLQEKKAYQMTCSQIEHLEIHPDGCENHRVSQLSGGNQQKVLLAKWLETAPKLLIVDEPTRGVDVGAKAKIHSFLRDLANTGVAVVMISSELPEILGLSDRIAVMHEGRLVEVMENDNLTEEAVLSGAFAQGGGQR